MISSDEYFSWIKFQIFHSNILKIYLYLTMNLSWWFGYMKLVWKQCNIKYSNRNFPYLKWKDEKSFSIAVIIYIEFTSFLTPFSRLVVTWVCTLQKISSILANVKFYIFWYCHFMYDIFILVLDFFMNAIIHHFKNFEY